ncbi:hemerythrin domain-containing protein [Konateibacter massiliensis]|uniref:hemerythrin domain-containing protein n=1 Tax=Konateibacter massiliensis TaxID=2002841 RepID=UPI000C155A72|nr:hemerythrin domain-containing protein [Konateibacter massiliensis]
MYSVELMVMEHDNILRLIDVVRAACCQVIEGRDVNDEDFRKMIEFARNYADKHHHGKEEQILFLEMTNHLGTVGANLIQHGMLVEHDLGRRYMMDLEAALNQYKEEPKTEYKLEILANAAGYANLLTRHIGKENEVVYTYAEKSLAEDILKSVDERVKVFEDEATENKIQEKYLSILKELEEKYLPSLL